MNVLHQPRQSTKGPRICLTGGWFSSDNIGDHAILCGILDTFSKLGNLQFSVISAEPAKVKRRYGLDAYAPKRTPIALLKNLLSADALVFTGGTPFYEAKPHMTYYAALAWIAHARKIPVLVFGISLRSFTSAYCHHLLRSIVNSATVLGGRENRTVRKFEELLPGKGKATLIPDAAIQMVPSLRERATELMSRVNLDSSAKNVAICMRDFRASRDFQLHHYSRVFDEKTLHRYHNSLLELTNHIVKKHDANVIFCPMHTNAPDDDRKVMKEVYKKIEDQDIRARCTVLLDQYHPRDMKAVLGTMYVTVGVRFHSLVLSTSMNVPALGIAYARKNFEILEQMGQGEYVVDLATMDEGLIIELFDRLVSNHGRVTEILRISNINMKNLFAQRVEEFGALLISS